MPQLIVGVMHMEFAGRGWSEKWYFGEGVTDLVAARDAFKNIVWGRSAFFGTGVSCTYARVSKIGPAPDKETVVLPYPIGPHPTWGSGGGPGDTIEEPDDPDVCVQQVFQVPGGRWNNRYFRGIPDRWVAGNVLGTGLLPYWQPSAPSGSVPDLSPTGGIPSHLGVCQGFWRAVLMQFVLTKKVTKIDYTAAAFRDVVYRQITSKKTGRPFGIPAGRRPSTTIK